MNVILLASVILLAYIIIRHIGFFAVGISIAIAAAVYYCGGLA